MGQDGDTRQQSQPAGAILKNPCFDPTKFIFQEYLCNEFLKEKAMKSELRNEPLDKKHNHAR